MIQHMHYQQFKESFDTVFEHDLAIFIDHVKEKTQRADIHHFLEHISVLGKNGKRLRPYIMSLGFGPLRDWSTIRSHLVGIEMLHLFALIHDDIIDQSPTRHTVPTLQHLPSHIPYHARMSTALLIGDLVFNWAYTLLTTPPHASIAEEITQLIDEVVIGQMHDVLLPHDTNQSFDDIITKMLLKTARYSFTRPLIIGGILGERAETWYEPVKTYGDALGIAFQIQDDTLDIFGNPKEIKKVLGGDIKEKQATLLTWFVNTHGNQDHQNKLATFLGKELTDPPALQQIFRDSGAYTFACTTEKQYFDEARHALESLSLKDEEKDIFNTFISLIAERSTQYES